MGALFYLLIFIYLATSDHDGLEDIFDIAHRSKFMPVILVDSEE
jgi:hypothetical protein